MDVLAAKSGAAQPLETWYGSPKYDHFWPNFEHYKFSKMSHLLSLREGNSLIASV